MDRGTVCAFDCYPGGGIYGRPGASTVVWDGVECLWIRD